MITSTLFYHIAHSLLTTTTTYPQKRKSGCILLHFNLLLISITYINPQLLKKYHRNRSRDSLLLTYKYWPLSRSTAFSISPICSINKKHSHHTPTFNSLTKSLQRNITTLPHPLPHPLPLRLTLKLCNLFTLDYIFFC